jgi:ABC-type dipeptide/oligopeptide/nickel transport system ATPase component
MKPQDGAGTIRSMLRIEDLSVSFESPGRGGRVEALRGVRLSLTAGQTLAVVGESGCGKSVMALSCLRLLPRGSARIDRGSIRFEGRDLLTISEREMRRVRGGRIAMIFQEPMTSLNPVETVGGQIMEAVRLHQACSRRSARTEAIEALRQVGITDAPARWRAYPHEFSGGMRQRAMIAMALAGRPAVLLADEPTTALDVTVQKQVLDLIRSIQRERGMAVMLITHNLGVAATHADAVAVMAAGRVVECASARSLLARPLHPYTRGLLASIPALRGRRERLQTVDDVLHDPAEFARLPGHDRGLVPWWTRPPAAGAAQPARSESDSDDVVLHEAEPQHWVACRDGGFSAHKRETNPGVF